MKSQRGNVAVRSRWTRNAMTQEFNEALQAHALYKRPQFLFGRLRGATDTVSIRNDSIFVRITILEIAKKRILIFLPRFAFVVLPFYAIQNRGLNSADLLGQLDTALLDALSILYCFSSFV